MTDGTEAMYISKGTKSRMLQSMADKADFGTVIKETDNFIFGDVGDVAAFIKEAELMNEAAKSGIKLLNQIASPGF